MPAVGGQRVRERAGESKERTNRVVPRAGLLYCQMAGEGVLNTPEPGPICVNARYAGKWKRGHEG